MSIFSQGIHLKGFHGDQIDLRHTHGRRQQQLVQALQKSSSFFKINTWHMFYEYFFTKNLFKRVPW